MPTEEIKELAETVATEVLPKAGEAIVKAPNILLEKAKGMLIGLVTGVTGTLAITKGIPAIRRRREEKRIMLGQVKAADPELLEDTDIDDDGKEE